MIDTCVCCLRTQPGFIIHVSNYDNYICLSCAKIISDQYGEINEINDLYQNTIDAMKKSHPKHTL